MHVNLEAAEFMSDILKESRNKTGKFSPFTTWKGTLRVFYLAQSGNRISITTEYLARLFQPTSESKQLVFRGAARHTPPLGHTFPLSTVPPPRGGEWGHRPAQEGNSPGLDPRVNLSEVPGMQPWALQCLCVLSSVCWLLLHEPSLSFPTGFMVKLSSCFRRAQRAGEARKAAFIYLFN